MKNWSLFIFFNTLYVVGLVVYLFLFILEIKNIILTNFIIIGAIILLFLKLYYWYSIREKKLNIEKKNDQKKFILRLVFCIFTYVTPVYCIIQEPNIKVSHYVLGLTYTIVTILAIIGIFIERSLFFLELKKRDKNAI